MSESLFSAVMTLSGCHLGFGESPSSTLFRKMWVQLGFLCNARIFKYIVEYQKKSGQLLTSGCQAVVTTHMLDQKKVNTGVY